MPNMHTQPVHSHSPSRSRRPLLLGAIAVMTLLSARRASAFGDPSTLEVGGATGEGTQRMACGPDIRVRHATAGVHFEKIVEDPAEKPGTGYVVDARAAIGTTTVTDVSDADKSGAGCPQTTAGPSNSCSSTSTQFYQAENGHAHVEGAAQVTGGYDWRTFAITGGVGLYGFGSQTSDATMYKQQYFPLPAVDLRVGRRVGFSGQFGVGAPPIAGLARWYGLYGIAQHRFQEGGEVGVGLMAIVLGSLEQRTGLFAKGAIPISSAVSLGAFGLLDASHQSSVGDLNWTIGGALTILLAKADE
ncbi:MAG: hypothetical protein ACHREM_13060 [Polyangiales bacterium]